MGITGGRPVSPPARAPGNMRQGAVPGYPARFRSEGRCAAQPRIKHHVLGVCCTLSNPCLVLPLRRIPQADKAHKELVALSRWPADSCRNTSSTVCRSLARLPDCAIAAWGAAPVADLCKHGRSNGGQAPAALNGGAVGNLGPTPRFHSPNFLHPQILATTMGDYDPAILFPDHPPDRATVSAQSQCRRADDTRATVSPAECIGHCGAWHTRTSESQLRR